MGETGSFKRGAMHALRALCITLPLAGAHAGAPPRLALQGVFPDRAILLIDGVTRVLAVGAASPEGVTLVEANLERAKVQVGTELIELTLDSARYGISQPPRALASLKLAPENNGHYFVDGTINGASVRFLVDTGATVVAINRDTARRLGLLYRTDGHAGQIETASGLVDAWYVTFESVTARTLSLKRVEGVVVEGEYPSTALLGQSFLNAFTLKREGPVLELLAR